jgi:hypothetical protein
MRIAAAATLPLLATLALAAAPDPSLILAKSRSDYLLGCGGCHGIEGKSNSRLVPDLRDQVGYFLRSEPGREYLVRLPNVAFYTASNAELAEMLNYMVFELGGRGVPQDAKPYSETEVAALRKSPLTEVSLIAYRTQLVEDLIAHHGAPASLRSYSEDPYAH